MGSSFGNSCRDRTRPAQRISPWAETCTRPKVRHILRHQLARWARRPPPSTPARGRARDDSLRISLLTSPARAVPSTRLPRSRIARVLIHNVEIWSPAGGFFADPKNWRRNTVVAAVGIATVAAIIFKKSTSLEERHAMPNHRIPSQRFAPQSFPVAEGK